MLLALFIALGKRRYEITGQKEQAFAHREVLAKYPLGLMDQFISIVASSILTVYAIYTFLAAAESLLMFTIPFVMFGIFRYLYLIYRQSGGEPEKLVLQDCFLMVNLLLWGAATFIILYLL